jgi:hypothetical protein
MRPGGTLVPYLGAGAPAIDDACTLGRAVATNAASVCGISRASVGDESQNSRDQKNSHNASSEGR